MKKFRKALIVSCLALITTMSAIPTYAKNGQSEVFKVFASKEDAQKHIDLYNQGKDDNYVKAFYVPMISQDNSDLKVAYGTFLPTEEAITKILTSSFYSFFKKDYQMEIHKLALEHMDTTSVITHLADNKCQLAYDVYNERYGIENPEPLKLKEHCTKPMIENPVPIVEKYKGKKLKLMINGETKKITKF